MPLADVLSSALTTLDAIGIDSQAAGASQPAGSLYATIRSAFPDEALEARHGYWRLRSALASALEKAQAAGL